MVQDSASGGRPESSVPVRPDERLRRAHDGWVAAGLVVITAAAYLRTFSYGLYLDDYWLLRPWTGGELARGFHDEFDPSGFNPPYFRPLAGPSFAFDWSIWGEWVPGYHVTNFALHVAAVLLVYRLLLRIGLARAAAALGATYFAIVPSNVATVVYIAERTDAMAATMILIAMLLIERYHRAPHAGLLVATNVCLIVALASKEIGVALVPMSLLLWGFLVLQSPATGPVDNGWKGARDAWRRTIDDVRSAWIDGSRRRTWLAIALPQLVVFAAYFAYREAVLPSDGSLGERYAETQSPLAALRGGVFSALKGVPWELRPMAVFPLAAIVLIVGAVRPFDARWRHVVLGLGLVVVGVVPLTVSGAVEPRLLYVAQIGMAVVVGSIGSIVVAAVRSARPTRRPALVIGALGGAVVMAATLTVSMVRAQDLFAEGSDKKLAADLRVYNELSSRWVLQRHLDAIEARLRTAGLID